MLIAISESRRPRRNSVRYPVNAGLRDIPEAARALGLQIQVVNVSTSREIEAAFATIARDRADALFVAPDGFFNSRRVQFATLATHYRIPAVYGQRELVEAGGLIATGPIFWTIIVKSASIPVKSSRARSQPNCRYCSRPNSSSSSTRKRRDCSASKCPTHCSCSPTR